MRSVTMLALVLMVGAAQAAMPSSAGSTASEVIRQVEDLLLAQPGALRTLEPSAKAIPRRNTADANLTAPVLGVGDLLFHEDGQPFRVVALAYPHQMVPVVCRNKLALEECGKLRVGQRISTVNDIATFQDGFYHNLSILYVRTLKTK
jgi:hypothetical protein